MSPPPVYRPNFSNGVANLAQRKAVGLPGQKVSPAPVASGAPSVQLCGCGGNKKMKAPRAFRPAGPQNSAAGTTAAQPSCECKGSGSCKCRKPRLGRQRGTIQPFMMPGAVIQRAHAMDTDSDSDYEPSDDGECDETSCVSENCDLKPAIVSVRASFYPGGYLVATQTWKATQLTALQSTCGVGNYRCPGCGVCKANGTATIDHHPTAVVQHWNATGKGQSRAQRSTFYNDTTNMRIRCGPCNHSGGLYDRDVEPTFTDTTACL